MTLENSKNYILSGYGFGEHGPYLILDTLVGEPLREYFDLRGRTFTFQKSEGRFCIGWRDIINGSSEPCPHRVELPDNKYQECMNCMKATGFNPAFYNAAREQMSPIQMQYNSFPHIVYLVYFASGKLKVGISSGKRYRKRWLGQGARAATVLGHFDDAYEARKLEAYLSKNTDAAEMMRSDFKRKLLIEPFDFENAKQEMNKFIDQLDTDVERNEIFDLTNDYFGDNALSKDVIDVTGDYISGEFFGMVGDVLIFSQQERQFMSSIRDLISCVVLCSNDIKKYDISPLQITLF